MPKGTVNKAFLLGRLGKDPELKYTSSGRPCAKFSIATNQAWKNEAGEKQEKTDWHNIVAWGKLAEIIGKWLRKGSLVFIQGRIENRTWDKEDGTKGYMTQIVAESLEMLGTKTKEEPEAQPEAEPEQGEGKDIPF